MNIEFYDGSWIGKTIVTSIKNKSFYRLYVDQINNTISSNKISVTKINDIWKASYNNQHFSINYVEKVNV